MEPNENLFLLLFVAVRLLIALPVLESTTASVGAKSSPTSKNASLLAARQSSATDETEPLLHCLEKQKIFIFPHQKNVFEKN